MYAKRPSLRLVKTGSAAQGIKRPELRDELYMQLLKQSRGNTTPSCAKVDFRSLPILPWFSDRVSSPE